MKIAILRTCSSKADLKNYNAQNIGFGTALIKLGVSVDFYSRFVGVEKNTLFKECDGHKLMLLPLNGFVLKEVTYYPGLVKQIINGGYDVVHMLEDSQLMNFIIVSAAKKRGLKTVLYQGMYEDYNGLGFIYQKIFDRLYKNRLIKNFDVVLAKTDFAKKYLEQKGYRNVSVQNVGLNIIDKTHLYDNFNSIENFTKKVDKVLLYVGVLEKRRDILFLLKCLKEINEKVIDYKVGLIVVGKGPDSELVSDGVDDLCLSENVLIVDEIPNDQLECVYKVSDLFVLPSYYEIYGMVILESLFYGVPVISSPTAGATAILNKELFGSIVIMEIDIWVENILRYLEGKHEKDIGNRRRSYIKKFFSWDNIAESYLKRINI